MTYEPDWSSPKTKRRVADVLDFCKFVVSPFGGTTIHNNQLVQVFGPRSSKLANYLRDRLLVKTGHYVVGHSSTPYRLDTTAYRELQDKLKQSDLCTPYQGDARKVMKFVQKHSAELGALTFEYTESSDRHWHPLQNIRRESKQEFWSSFGLPYDYDIEACAPTVLMALAKRYSLPALVLDGVQEYLTDKRAFREHVAGVGGLTLIDAKRLVNSLFNGARLTPHWSCAAYVLVGYDRDRLQALKTDQKIRRLRAAVRLIWARIGFVQNKSYKSGSSKWSLYFNWERQIMDVVREELKTQDVRYFTEHDGFRTNKQIDVIQLQELIKQKIGIDLKISSSHT